MLVRIAAVVAIVVWTVGFTPAAHAENWLETSNDTSIDLESYRIAYDAENNPMVVFVVDLNCNSNHRSGPRQVRAVKRRDCPALLNGGQTIMMSIYGVGVDTSKEKRNLWIEADEHGRSWAMLACHRYGAPEDWVEFENQMGEGIATVYVDGRELCRLHPDMEVMGSEECRVSLYRFDRDPMHKHAVHIVAGDREVNSTIAVTDCHWNWYGIKVFQIQDDRLHLACGG